MRVIKTHIASTVSFKRWDAEVDVASTGASRDGCESRYLVKNDVTRF